MSVPRVGTVVIWHLLEICLFLFFYPLTVIASEMHNAAADDDIDNLISLAELSRGMQPFPLF